MTPYTAALGKGVAIASLVFENGYDISLLTDKTDEDIFYYVQEIYRDLKQNGVKDLLVIPSTSCSSKESVLLHNDRFFIGHTLINPALSKKKHDKLIKHLNDCFACFEIYSQFYKDYYLAYQEIRQTLTDK